MSGVDRLSELDSMAALYEDVETFFADFFSWFGRLVARYPLTFALVPLLVCALLSLGNVTFSRDTDVISVYAPSGSQAEVDRDVIARNFQARNSNLFSHQQLEAGLFSSLIFSAKDSNTNESSDILDSEHLQEVLSIHEVISNLTATGNADGHTYDEICATRDSKCVTDDVSILSMLQQAGGCSNNSVTSLPSDVISGAWRDSQGCWRANAVRLQYNLAQDTHHHTRLSESWLSTFTRRMTSLHSDKLNIRFMTSRSLAEELTRSVEKDSVYVALAVVVVAVYVSFLLSGGDWVSTRLLVGWAGIASALLSVAATSGLLSLCGAAAVDSCRVLTFALLGKML